MGTKNKSNMKTTNAVRSLVLEINRLDTKSAFAFGRGRNHTGALDGKFADLAALLKVPVNTVEEAYAKLLAVTLMPEPQPVRRMARPLPVRPVVAPKLTLKGVEPVTVKSWSPSRGEFDEVIGYNVTRVIDGKEDVQFRPRCNNVRPQVAVMADWSPSRRALWVCPQGECSGNPCGTEFEIEDGVDGACPKCGTVLHAVSCK